MARTARQLRGWQYNLEEEETKISDGLDGGRRRRRGRGEASKVALKRELDDLELRQGDCVFVSDDSGSPAIGLIKDIVFGTDSFMEVRVFWFVRRTDLAETKELPADSEHTSNDLFLTPLVDKIMLKDVVGKCRVMSVKSLGETVIDDSNRDETFVCRRFCDSDGEYFTEQIDWDEMMENLRKNSDDFYQFVKNLTVVPTVGRFNKKLKQEGIDPRSIEIEEKKLEEKTESKSRSRSRSVAPGEGDDVEMDSGSDDDEDADDGFYVYDDDDDMDTDTDGSEDEEDDSDIDADFRYGYSYQRKKKKGRKRRSRLTTKSRSQKVKDKVSKAAGKKRGSPKKPRAPYGSLKKRSGLPRLPTVARQIGIDEDEKELDIDAIFKDGDDEGEGEADGDDRESTTSKVLRKAKKVLHTSAKLKALPCREEEFSQLFYSIESAVSSKTGRCIYVSGTPGVGKTATIREVIKQLSASFIAETGKKQFNYVEINGLKLISPQAAYEALWEKVSHGEKATATKSLTLLEKHFKTANEQRKPLVVLLDELDQIVTRNQSVMYNFFNWPSYENSRLIVIAVANTMDLPERMLTNKISSRLGLTRLQFSSYTYQQLSEIIRNRLERLGKLNEERLVVSKDAVEFASRKVASVSGDARRALMICIRAVEIAELEFLGKTEEEQKRLDGKYTVTIMHIMKAVNETASSPVSNYLGGLSFMGKMFLAAIMLRMKRTGTAEVSVGDVLDELNNQFHVVLFTELKNRLKEEELEMVKVLYEGNERSQLRPTGMAYVMKDLEENGVVITQQIRLERKRLLRLNISEDEIMNNFKKDPLVKEIIVEV